MKLRYLLDTDTCIYIKNHRPPAVLKRFSVLRPGETGMSVITFGELYTGAMKSQHADIALQKLQRLSEIIPVQAMYEKSGSHYGTVRGALEKAGTPIGNNDLWIAAHALELGITLITNNIDEFKRVPGLVLENWVK